MRQNLRLCNDDAMKRDDVNTKFKAHRMSSDDLIRPILLLCNAISSKLSELWGFLLTTFLCLAMHTSSSKVSCFKYTVCFMPHQTLVNGVYTIPVEQNVSLQQKACPTSFHLVLDRDMYTHLSPVSVTKALKSATMFHVTSCSNGFHRESC